MGKPNSHRRRRLAGRLGEGVARSDLDRRESIPVQGRGDGFMGQRIVVVPRPLLPKKWWGPTDAGLFPRAAEHHVKRVRGAPETVLIYCVAGAGVIRCGPEEMRLEQGQLAVMQAGVGHEYFADQQSPWSIYWIHLAGDDLETLLGFQVKRLSVVRLAAEPVLHESFEQVLSTLEQGFSAGQLLLASALTRVLLVRIGQARAKYATSLQMVGGHVDPIADVITYLQALVAKGADRVTVAELAGRAGLSPARFADRFKQRTGFSPIDYFLRMRLQRAMSLVVTTDMPLKQVASEVGFSCQLYFSRQFRRIYGAPPSSFRPGPHRTSGGGR